MDLSKNKQVLGIILTIVFFVGCETKTTHENKGEVIHVNPHDAQEFVNLSEIADSIKLIKLQTVDDDVIGRVGSIIIKNRFIYVQDLSQKVVFVFNKEGKFVSKLNKRGQGPGEYVFMGPMFIDDREEYLELMDFYTKSILVYVNISFEYIKTVPFHSLSFNTFRKHQDFYYFSTQQIDNLVDDKKTNAGLIIVDDKNKISTLFDKQIETNNHYYSMNIESFTQNDKNQLFFSLMFDNTFYRLEKGEAFPTYTADFGKYGMKSSIGLLSTQEQMKYIEDMRGVAAFPVLNINNSNIMSFSYIFKQNRNEKVKFYKKEDCRFYLKLKDNNKIFHVKYIRNNLSNFPEQVFISTSLIYGCPHEAWFEDYLVDIIIPERYFDDPFDKIYVEGIGEVTAMDNPIIVMMKLKKQY